MPGKMSDPGTMPKKIMKSGGDTEEDEESDMMPKKIMKFGKAPDKGSGKHRKRLDPGEYRKR